MSAFLGPIHYWLFNKIALQEQLENNLVLAFKKSFGEEVDAIAESSVEQ